MENNDLEKPVLRCEFYMFKENIEKLEKRFSRIEILLATIFISELLYFIIPRH